MAVAWYVIPMPGFIPSYTSCGSKMKIYNFLASIIYLGIGPYVVFFELIEIVFILAILYPLMENPLPFTYANMKQCMITFWKAGSSCDIPLCVDVIIFFLASITVWMSLYAPWCSISPCIENEIICYYY